MNSQQLRDSVNEKLIEAMSKNILPWRRPWSGGGNGGRHRNFATNRAYSGVNPLLLEMHCLKHGLESNRWATFRQWESLGCMVKKRPADVPAGQWGCTVIFCKPVKKIVIDKESLRQNGRFIEREQTKIALNEYRRESSETFAFMQDALIIESRLNPGKLDGISTSDEPLSAWGSELEQAWYEWCKINHTDRKFNWLTRDLHAMLPNLSSRRIKNPGDKSGEKDQRYSGIGLRADRPTCRLDVLVALG